METKLVLVLEVKIDYATLSFIRRFSAVPSASYKRSSTAFIPDIEWTILKMICMGVRPQRRKFPDLLRPLRGDLKSVF